MEYELGERAVKRTVVAGKVVLDHGSLLEDAEVGVFVARQEGTVHLPPVLQKEL